MFLGLILIISLANGEVSGKLLPAFIHPCPTPVPKPDCLKRTIQEVIPIFVKGIPSLGVDSSDPLYRDVEHLEPLPGFRVELKNGKVTGLRKCIVDSAKYDRNQLNATIHCNLTVRGHYKAIGRILIVNMDGDGDAKLTSKNVILKVKVKFEDHIRNGIVYHDVKNFTLKHRFADRVTFGLTNLFKGNPQLSEQVLIFLNENWSAVAAEIGGPIVNVGAVAIVNILKQFFGTVPKNEIFPYL